MKCENIWVSAKPFLRTMENVWAGAEVWFRSIVRRSCLLFASQRITQDYLRAIAHLLSLQVVCRMQPNPETALHQTTLPIIVDDDHRKNGFQVTNNAETLGDWSLVWKYRRNPAGINEGRIGRHMPSSRPVD